MNTIKILLYFNYFVIRLSKNENNDNNLIILIKYLK
jgi:hypothetical protein